MTLLPIGSVSWWDVRCLTIPLLWSGRPKQVRRDANKYVKSYLSGPPPPPLLSSEISEGGKWLLLKCLLPLSPMNLERDDSEWMKISGILGFVFSSSGLFSAGRNYMPKHRLWGTWSAGTERSCFCSVFWLCSWHWRWDCLLKDRDPYLFYSFNL